MNVMYMVIKRRMAEQKMIRSKGSNGFGSVVVEIVEGGVWGDAGMVVEGLGFLIDWRGLIRGVLNLDCGMLNERWEG